jgi:hypothetical protein
VFAFGRKPVLDLDGEPCFAELAILRTLLAHGWSGASVEAYNGPGGQRYRFLQSMPANWQFESDFVMPEDKRSIVESISGRMPRRNGVAWRRRTFLRSEATKAAGHVQASAIALH